MARFQIGDEVSHQIPVEDSDTRLWWSHKGVVTGRVIARHSSGGKRGVCYEVECNTCGKIHDYWESELFTQSEEENSIEHRQKFLQEWNAKLEMKLKSIYRIAHASSSAEFIRQAIDEAVKELLPSEYKWEDKEP